MLLSGVIFIALKHALKAQMVPEMNKNKPYLSRTGNSYIKVLIFFIFFFLSNLGLCFDLH